MEGDSQRIRVNQTPDASGSYVQVLENCGNLGPIHDMCKVENHGRDQVGTCSGRCICTPTVIYSRNGKHVYEDVNIEVTRMCQFNLADFPDRNAYYCIGTTWISAEENVPTEENVQPPKRRRLNLTKFPKMESWGLEVKPWEPRRFHVRNKYRKLHLTKTTLGEGLGKEKCVIQVSVGDFSPVDLCTLLPDEKESCSLSFMFNGGDSLEFWVIGDRSIHLTGYLKDIGENEEIRAKSLRNPKTSNFPFRSIRISDKLRVPPGYPPGACKRRLDLTKLPKKESWGLDVKPWELRHFYVQDKYRKLHVTKATLGEGLGKEKCVIQVSVGDFGPVDLCTLLPDEKKSCSLSVVFNRGDLLKFWVIGDRSIHLTGYSERHM